MFIMFVVVAFVILCSKNKFPQFDPKNISELENSHKNEMKNGGGKLCGKHKNEQTMKTFRKIKDISEIKQNKRKKNTQTTNDKKQIRATSSTKIKKNSLVTLN